jgi:drug/metabolite transporter (DMT)-like permease
MIFGAIMSIMQLSFLTQSESAGLAALTLVWNVLLSKALLNESYNRLEYAGTAIVASGTAAAVAFKANNGGSHEDLSISAVLLRLTRPSALAGGALLIALLAVCIITIHRHEGRERAFSDQQYSASQPPSYMCFLRTFTAGAFAGCSGLAAKCLIEVLAAGGRQHALQQPFVWCLFLVIPCSIVTQVAFLNSALRRYAAKVVVPIYQGMLLLTGVSFGQLFLMESLADSASATAMLWMSVAVSLSGIGVIFRGASQPRDGSRHPLPSAPCTEAEQEPLAPSVYV